MAGVIFGSYGPQRPRFAKAMYHLSRAVFRALFQARSIHRPDGAFAQRSLEAFRKRVERGETVYLLGLGPAGNNSGVALVEASAAGGLRLLANEEEERYSGVKFETRYPEHAVEVLKRRLDQRGLSAKDIHACLATFAYEDFLAFATEAMAETFPRSLPLLMPEASHYSNFNHGWSVLGVPRLLGKQLGLPGPMPIIGMPHHDNHAYLAYGMSPFYPSDEPVMVSVIDAYGDHSSISMYLAKGNELTRIRANRSLFDSLGVLYTLISSTQGGWTPLSSEGRYMGAAAWGDGNRLTNPFYRQLRELVHFANDGEVYLNRHMTAWHIWGELKPYNERLERVLGKAVPPDKMWNPDAVLDVDTISHSPITQERVDKAAATQLLFEDVLFHILGHFIRTTGSRKLVLSGGTALNCVANMRLLETFDEAFYSRVHGQKRRLELWVPPVPGDAGVPIGACYRYGMLGGARPAERLRHAFYCGDSPTAAEIERALPLVPEIGHRDLGTIATEEGRNRLADFMAFVLARDGVLGLFQGRSETGPRALGHRSIIANPCNPKTLENLNRLVKRRERVRPLAPMATREAAHRFFELSPGASADDYCAYDYMVLTARARPEAYQKIPAVVHHDGTARVQIVRESIDPLTHAFLKAMGRRLAVEVSVNTSLNVASPIVQTPAQALEVLRRSSGLTGLILVADDGRATLAWHDVEAEAKDRGRTILGHWAAWEAECEKAATKPDHRVSPPRSLETPLAASAGGAALTERYARHCRPELASMLQALRLDVSYHRGFGTHLFCRIDGEEVRVLDALGGYGACLFGHNHPQLVEVAATNLREQVVAHAQGSIRAGAAALAEKLEQMLQKRYGRSYIATFASTGAEAVEAGLRHATLRHERRMEQARLALERSVRRARERIESGQLTVGPEFFSTAERILGSGCSGNVDSVLDALEAAAREVAVAPPVFLTVDRAFHGKTSGAHALSEEGRSSGKGAGNHRVVFFDPEQQESLERAAAETRAMPTLETRGEGLEVGVSRQTCLAGLFLEPLQGEGGVRPLSRESLARCRAFADLHQLPLILDEIQSGMGRTGTFLYAEQLGVAGDYVLLSKSLGGGLAKISALLVAREHYEPSFGATHLSTFGEDDPSAQIALAAVSMLEDETLMNRAAQRGREILDGLLQLQRRYPKVIADIRGAGLMVGVELANQERSGSPLLRLLWSQRALGYIVAAHLLHEHRIRVGLCLSDPAILRLEPAADISTEDCVALVSALGRVAEILHKGNAYELLKFLVGRQTPHSTHSIAEVTPIGAGLELPETQPKEVRKVSFIGHLIDGKDFGLLDPSLSPFSNEELEAIITRFGPFVAPHVLNRRMVRSKTGECVLFEFLGLAIPSVKIEEHLRSRHSDVLAEPIGEALRLAEDGGAEVLGFGGYTSIATQNCLSVFSKKMRLTSGNALTTAMSLQAIRRTCEERGIGLDRACFAAVGAGGNIGSIHVRLMAEECPRILLLGRPGRLRPLERVAGKVYLDALESLRRGSSPPRGVAQAIADTQTVRALLRGDETQPEDLATHLRKNLEREMGDRAPVIVTADPGQLVEADVIVGASNSASPVIFAHHLKRGPVVICDLAVPGDVDESIHSLRPDVTVIQGGLVRVPGGEFELTSVPLESGTCFACMAETMLLGLAGPDAQPSRGAISKEQVKALEQLAATHGFQLWAPKARGGRRAVRPEVSGRVETQAN